MIYKAIDVWKRLNGGRLVRYRCFELHPDGGYCVQSADFYDSPADPTQVRHLESQYLELLSEEAPDSRSGAFRTIEEAIAGHDEEFSAVSSSDQGDSN